MKTSKRKLLQSYFPEISRAVPGWGNKPSARRAKIWAAATLRKPIFLEDGFLRSFSRSDTPISLICDDRGIYYDARRPSELEILIGSPLTIKQENRTARLISLWRSNRVSKYNDMPDPKEVPKPPYILVIDQVSGDASISGGLADPSSFEKMLEDALTQNLDAQIIVKTHPDVAKKRKKGNFENSNLIQNPRVTVVSDPVHPVDLIRNAEAVYTVTSQTGFEALIHDVPVHTYGVPFYAGWGLTKDHASKSNPEVQRALSRRGNASLEMLVHSTLVDYPRYLNPEDGSKITPEQAIILVGRHRSKLSLRTGTIHAVGFSLWKKPTLRRFLKPAEVEFHETMRTVPDDSTVALWGAHGTEHLSRKSKIIRIEDGFIRSKGLGADLNAPSSWVLDDIGVYFDSTKPSRLEALLQHEDFPLEILVQSRELRDRIIKGGFTKYNLGGVSWTRPIGEDCVILIPGQVETDASIKLGSPKVKTNLDLVKAVRVANPDAYIVYKTHPDVENGYRTKGETEHKIPQFCDEVLKGGDIVSLLSQVDEVHTMTSLTGFEAVMRGLRVTCYGQPFYSGWGLTKDIHPCARRTRRRSLDELISAALIEYPDYMSRQDGSPISPMAAIREIEQHKPGIISRLPFRRGLVRCAARRAEKKRGARA